MKKNSTALFTIAMLALIGCSKQSDAPQASSTAPSTPVQATKIEPTRPEPKKKLPVDQIDFSKYPGVIKSAAFGYYFGLTPEQIQEAGIEIESTNENGGMSTYQTDKAPLAWSGAGKYLLVFYQNKLLKIIAVGQDITGDATGSAGKNAFKELLTSLTEKYGKPKLSTHRTGLRLYEQRDEFYQCLAYDGCGFWYDLFELPDRLVVIELKGTERGKGFIKLVYESQPEWGQAVDRHNADKKEKTKKGL